MSDLPPLVLRLKPGPRPAARGPASRVATSAFGTQPFGRCEPEERRREIVSHVSKPTKALLQQELINALEELNSRQNVDETQWTAMAIVGAAIVPSC